MQIRHAALGAKTRISPEFPCIFGITIQIEKCFEIMRQNSMGRELSVARVH